MQGTQITYGGRLWFYLFCNKFLLTNTLCIVSDFQINQSFSWVIDLLANQCWPVKWPSDWSKYLIDEMIRSSISLWFKQLPVTCWTVSQSAEMACSSYHRPRACCVFHLSPSSNLLDHLLAVFLCESCIVCEFSTVYCRCWYVPMVPHLSWQLLWELCQHHHQASAVVLTSRVEPTSLRQMESYSGTKTYCQVTAIIIVWRFI